MFVVICTILTIQGFAQSGLNGYTAVYLTEVKSRFKIDFKSMNPVTKEDSILNEVSELFLQKMQQKDLLLLIRDSVKIKEDTTFIKSYSESNYLESMNTEVKINIRANERILHNNKFLIRDDSTGRYRLASGDYEYFMFIKEDSAILGYNTKLFQNGAGTIKIWVSTNLPKELNPSIKIANPVGGILKYEIVKDDQVISSILKNLTHNEIGN